MRASDVRRLALPQHVDGITGKAGAVGLTGIMGWLLLFCPWLNPIKSHSLQSCKFAT
jgi:hypothetical protein